MRKKGLIKTLIRLLKMSKGSGPKLVFSIILAAITSVLTLLIPYFFGKIVDLLTDDVDMGEVLTYLLFILSFIVITSVLTYVMNTLNYMISYDTVKRLRDSAYEKINRLPVSYIEKTSVGSVESLIINDCETVSDGLLVSLNQFFTGLITIIVVFVIMFVINWRLALLIALITPVTLLITAVFIRSINDHLKAHSSAKGKQTGFLNEMINNLREIRTFGIEKSIKDKLTDIDNDYRKIAVKATFLSSLVNPSTRLFNGTIYALVALLGALSVISGGMTVGALSSLLAYATTYMKPINEISGVFSELSDSLACAARIFEYLDEEETERLDKGTIVTFDGDIELRDLVFSYDGTRNVIDKMNLKIPSGTKVAIVGPTGCGKTTLINLLMRFYEPVSGEILIDGRPINDLSKNVLRSHVGMVPQDTWFKTATIRRNILYGVHRKETTDEDIIKTSKILGVHSFVRNLPRKYDEIITSKREDISDGQRQLLSIDRAFMSDPEILILDEATSSVDAITENKITSAVRMLCKGRTSVIIAHRLSTIIDADMIVVMDKGRIIESGDHETLVKQGGYYSKLYDSFMQ
ncbi:MAG: ABC transporter ATP-binding protein/permease [Clostridiales bacterium]|nr:ABC transporter ATP-binding protein/permease [Clostridiales bacterium]